jgi:hypothetical protein
MTCPLISLGLNTESTVAILKPLDVKSARAWLSAIPATSGTTILPSALAPPWLTRRSTLLSLGTFAGADGLWAMTVPPGLESSWI